MQLSKKQPSFLLTSPKSAPTPQAATSLLQREDTAMRAVTDMLEGMHTALATEHHVPVGMLAGTVAWAHTQADTLVPFLR